MSEHQQRTPLLPSVFSHSDADLTKPSPSAASPSEPSYRKKPSITLSPAASPNQEAPLELSDDEPDAPEVASYAYDEPSADQLLPPPNFAPFFTLVEDAATGEHYHPTVHYIFADDDPDILASTSLAAVESPSSNLVLSPTSGSPEKTSSSGSALPPPRAGTKEHYIVIDLAGDGQTITSTQSMSGDWQVTSASVTPAPTWDEDAGTDALMLRIEGRGLAKNTPSPETLLEQAKKESKGDVLAAMTGLTDKFNQGMDVLDKIVTDESVGPTEEERE